MKKTWLIIDCCFLCYRGRYAILRDNKEADPESIVFCFINQIRRLNKQFMTNDIAFCWDSPISKRRLVYPEYKKPRWSRDMTPEERVWEKGFIKQMNVLRDEVLPNNGYMDVFMQEGYEGDDLMASIAANLDGDGVIVTSDQDLYQCITDKISMYDCNTITTMESFSKKYRIHPNKWKYVKSLGGCSSDNVPGIKGVGEKTAIKYIKGELAKNTKVYQRIISEDGVQLEKRNRLLTWLPFDGVEDIVL